MTELYPSDAELNALSGTVDGEQEVLFIAAGESPYYTSFYKMLHRLLLVARRAGDLRVYKDGDLTFGVRPGRFMDGGEVRDYAGATGQALTNNATNYIFLLADGELTVSTEGFPDPGETPHLPLATIVTSAGAYAHGDITDHRGRGIFRCVSALSAETANQAQAFFDSSDLTGAEAEALSDGSNADSLHRHGSEGIEDGTVTASEIADDAVTKDKIDGSVAGAGLTQNEDGALEANPDGATLGISDGAIQVADGGVGAAQLADDAVTKDKIDGSVAGEGLTQNEDGSLTANADGTTLELADNALQVKDEGIGAAKLSSGLRDSIPNLYFSVSVENNDTIPVLIRVKDAADDDLLGRFRVRAWISTSSFGPPGGSQSVAVTNGTVLEEVVADKDYELVTDTDGQTTMDISIQGAATRYVMAEVDGRIYSSGQITWSA